MNITKLVSLMIGNVRAKGQKPAIVAVSPDMYALWEQQHGSEPCTIGGLPICIRDNFKPRVILVMGEREYLSHSGTSEYLRYGEEN